MTHSIRPRLAALGAALVLITSPLARAGDELLLQTLVDPLGDAFGGLGGVPSGALPAIAPTTPTLSALASDGEWCVVGAPTATVDGRAFAGEVLVFQRTPNGWRLDARLQHPAPPVDDDWDVFGNAVDVSGDRIAVSAPKAFNAELEVPAGAGEVFVFERVLQEWVPTLHVVDDGPGSFGDSLSLEQDLLAVSTFLPSEVGRVQLFERDGFGWLEGEELVLPTMPVGLFPNFVSALALEGERLAVGSAPADGQRGAVFLYSRDPAGWQLDDVLTSDAPSLFFLGTDLAFDGDRIVGTGQFDATPPALPNGSYVLSFEETEAGWVEQAPRIVNLGGSPRTELSCDLAGDTLAVGHRQRPFPFGAVEGPGFATVFRHDGEAWRPLNELAPGDALPNDLFGTSVALDGEGTLFVAAPNYEPGELESQGAVLAYDVAVDTWTNEGFELVGTKPDQLLQGFGDLSDDSIARVQLVNAAASTPMLFFAALESTPVPFVGGTLAAFPTIVPPLLTGTDPQGRFEISFPVRPGAIPTGEVWFQAAYLDLQTPIDVALSNALRGETP